MGNAVEATKKRVEAIFQHMLLKSNVSKEEALGEVKAEFSALLEELDIAYEELQASNESLVQAQHQLEKERQRYHELFYYAPDAYIETDMDGKILQANEAASTLLNLSLNSLNNKPLSSFVVNEEREKFFNMLNPPQRIQELELNMQSSNLPPFTVSISLVPVKDRNGRLVAVRWLIRDINELKLKQAVLAASEERFRTIFTHSHMGMLLTDPNGMILESNLAFERMIGYVHEELQGHEIKGLVYLNDREEIDEGRSEILNGTRISCVLETRFFHKNDQEIWTRQTISALPDMHGEPVYFIHMVENITEKKQSDEELAEMKRRMIDSIESERLHLAQELHDGPIQELYSAVFKLNEPPSNGSIENDNIKETQDIIKQVAGTLREICGDLRPPTLSNFGLDRALRTHVEQTQDQNKGLTITLEADRDDRILSQEMRLALFRIYQQCIANVLRHAQATEVIVRLEIGEEDVVLQVEDNGVGFEPPMRIVELLRTGHYGLAGISERVESLNGSLIIDTNPGSGTRVTVEIPRQVVPPEKN